MKSAIKIIDKINNDIRENVLKSGIALACFVISYFIWFNVLLSFVVASAVAIIILRWDSRIYIAIGLVFLIACPILLAFGQDAIAEKTAIYAYYMMALGIFLQLVHYVRGLLFTSKEHPQFTSIYEREKKIIYVSIAVISIMAILFSGSFAFLYKKMKGELDNNIEQVDYILGNKMNENKQIMRQLSENQQKLADEVYAAKEVNELSAKILIENASGDEELAAQLQNSIQEMGYANVYVKQNGKLISDFTLIEHCVSCAGIVEELKNVMYDTLELTARENKNFTNEIVITLGADQVIIGNSDISLSLIHGSDFGDDAREMKRELSAEGFNVASVGIIGRSDYEKTVVKYSSPNKRKAQMVKDYLDETRDVELEEVEKLATDAAIVLGKKINANEN
ncbi:LytR C-terminal domain-containing protein [Patescibacteria group bacterium]|nr:LytR C-terminal domain-containing protein [Patescibacteria group bacterium]